MRETSRPRYAKKSGAWGMKHETHAETTHSSPDLKPRGRQLTDQRKLLLSAGLTCLSVLRRVKLDYTSLLGILPPTPQKKIILISSSSMQPPLQAAQLYCELHKCLWHNGSAPASHPDGNGINAHLAYFFSLLSRRKNYILLFFIWGENDEVFFMQMLNPVIC